MAEHPPLPPAVLTPAPRPSALPVEEREYQHFLRTPRARWWRGVLAILALVVAFALVSTALTAAVVVLDLATGRTTTEQLQSGPITVTPMIFLANNLSLALLTPLAMLLQWAFFGARPRWLSSVAGGFRWRWFGRAALVVVPVWLVYVAVSFLLSPEELSGALSEDAVLVLVVVLLTTPLQAAGEEYGARGLVARSAGSWFAGPRAALVVGGILANLLFMVAHAATDPWLQVYYFTFGAALSVLAWRTGGLEVPVLVHAVNNLFLLVPVALHGDLSGAFERGPGAGGPVMLLPTTVMLVMTVVLSRWAGRRQVQRRSAPGAARRPDRPVAEPDPGVAVGTPEGQAASTPER
ncbi:Membrane protease YdiL, CAAX protease family [Friedmanniella luteola]|uniref:Membrane protease YdiL, CAAX protease family n=1 Tax=Friedmanniella luteola TaxID=546871 RepID=A0A1H1SLJ7_9ACTN|nr:CPBP family intramembrane glutamic endopeptidase [Friedmanniella luteola]SDS48900.1 Membrane protease YdiL, CAAX protease family [Friedmanniella luteola]